MLTVLRIALTATIPTTHTPAPLTAITARHGLAAASSLVSDPGTDTAGIRITIMATTAITVDMVMATVDTTADPDMDMAAYIPALMAEEAVQPITAAYTLDTALQMADVLDMAVVVIPASDLPVAVQPPTVDLVADAQAVDLVAGAPVVDLAAVGVAADSVAVVDTWAEAATVVAVTGNTQ